MPTDALKEFAEYERALATAEAEARYTQSAADLSRMKKEAVGRDDKGRW